MRTLFLDANILFSAVYSDHGASRALFDLAKFERIILVTHIYAVREAKVNLDRKLPPEKMSLFFLLVSLFNHIEHTSFDSALMKKYESLIVLKDLPILISAISQDVDFLITLDRKHFMTEHLEKSDLPFKILLPGEYLKNEV